MVASVFETAQSKYQIIFSTILLTMIAMCGLYSISPPEYYKRTMPRTVTAPAHAPDVDSSLLKGSLNRLGYTLADLPDRNHLWTHNIRLCVMFNQNGVEPNAKVTNLLTSYYFPFFRKITLIFGGQTSDTSSWIPNYVQVLSCESYLGWYQHKCIRKCIQEHDNKTEGFLYIADDMFINITKMATYPKNKIWYQHMMKKNFSLVVNPGAAGWDWMWWGIDGNNVKFNKTIQSFPNKWKALLKKYHGFPDDFSVAAISDIIFIPAVAVPRILPVLEHIIGQGNLFCEIATPLAVNVASHDFVKMEYGYLWNDRSPAAIERMSKTNPFVHPVKLGIAVYAKLWVSLMEQLNQTVMENQVKHI